MADEQTGQNFSSFPGPPSYWKLYTDENLALESGPLKKQDESQESKLEGGQKKKGDEVEDNAIPDEPDVEDLKPPRTDWIEEEGSITIFGDHIPVSSSPLYTKTNHP
jgi:hypothetical protein